MKMPIKDEKLSIKENFVAESAYYMNILNGTGGRKPPPTAEKPPTRQDTPKGDNAEVEQAEKL